MRPIPVLMGALAGVAVTLVLFFVPFIEELGPLAGGFAGGFIANSGIMGGILVGILMAGLMVAPALFLSELLAGILSGIPVISGLVRGAGYLISVGIVVYTGIFGILGGALGGYIRGEQWGEMAPIRHVGKRPCPKCGAPFSKDMDHCPYCDTDVIDVDLED